MPLPSVGWVEEGFHPVRDTLDLIGELGFGSRFAASVAGWRWPMTRSELYLQMLLQSVTGALGVKVPTFWPWDAATAGPAGTAEQREAAKVHHQAHSAYKGPWPDDAEWEQPTFDQPDPEPDRR